MQHNDSLPEKLTSFLKNDSFVIFLFHGVVSKSNYVIRNSNKKHMESNLFVKCMKILSERGQPFSMNDLLYFHTQKQNLPPKSFAITFDDGFENNLSIASPILYDFKIPATIYITTEFIEQNSMSWIDRIEFALEYTSSDILDANWLKKKIPIKNKENKLKLLNMIRNYVKNTKEVNSNIFAAEICNQLGFSRIISSDDPIDKKMNWKQVSEVGKSDFFTIGGHSHTHQILSFLDSSQLAYELDTSIRLLKDKADIKPIHYSYPEGLKHCYSENVIKELKKRGVLCCPTAINGTNKILDDLFHLKRVML
jgi:peptidoglycan/xylan/chitin deacetylase (PgdA/CDA1 family)